nr:hypothetical protein Iba_chr02aCG15990 [Ipomoea batatas]GMD09438.1 hypothetical protein Iba_chr06dCG8180 [Ipomoea batatas]
MSKKKFFLSSNLYKNKEDHYPLFEARPVAPSRAAYSEGRGGHLKEGKFGLPIYSATCMKD